MQLALGVQFATHTNNTCIRYLIVAIVNSFIALCNMCKRIKALQVYTNATIIANKCATMIPLTLHTWSMYADKDSH